MDIDIGIGGGIENISQFEMSEKLVEKDNLDKDILPVQDCLLPMGITSEVVLFFF